MAQCSSGEMLIDRPQGCRSLCLSDLKRSRTGRVLAIEKGSIHVEIYRTGPLPRVFLVVKGASCVGCLETSLHSYSRRRSLLLRLSLVVGLERPFTTISGNMTLIESIWI